MMASKWTSFVLCVGSDASGAESCAYPGGLTMAVRVEGKDFQPSHCTAPCFLSKRRCPSPCCHMVHRDTFDQHRSGDRYKLIKLDNSGSCGQETKREEEPFVVYGSVRGKEVKMHSRQSQDMGTAQCFGLENRAKAVKKKNTDIMIVL